MTPQAQKAEDRLEIDEMIVRGFVILGLVIWTVAAIGALMGGHTEVFYGYAAVALVVLSAYVVGLYDERIAAAELTIAGGVTIAWGITAGWELGVWVMVGAMLIVPIVVAGAMYLFAEHEEEVIDHAEETIPSHMVHA